MANEHVREAPTNVSAMATGPTWMTVTWDAPWYTGSSPFSDESDEVVMVFSTASLATEEFAKAKGRLSMFLRTTLTARRPIGLAARDSQNEYRGATQRADDDFEPLRRYSADEDSGWVPPTSKE